MAKEKRNQQNEQKKDEKELQNTHRIYDYIKENIGLFAGIGTVILAVLSAIIGFCGYLYESAMLKYWNVSVAYINLDTPDRIYGTIVSFAFVCMMFIIMAVMNEIADKCVPFKRMKVYRKMVRFEYCKTRCGLMFNKIKSLFVKKQDGVSAQRSAQHAKRELNLLECSYKAVRKSVNQQCIAQMIMLYFLFWVVVYLWISIGIAGNTGTVLDLAGMAALVSGILFVPISLSSKNFVVNKKKIKNDAKADYNGQRIKTEVPAVTLVFKKFFSGDYSFYPSDKKIKRMIPRFILCVLLVTVVFVVVFQLLGYEKAKAQREFMITIREEEEYAVIYNNGKDVVLVRCEEIEDAKGTSLKIDTANQRIEPVEGLEYMIKVYYDAFTGSIGENDE